MNQEILDYFEDFRKICAVLENFGVGYNFAPPATDEEIAEYENKTGKPLPELYKQWLSLTNYAYMADGYLEIFSPCVYDDVIMIGSLVGDGDDFFIDMETGQFYEEFEDECTYFIDFIDFLDNAYTHLEEFADNNFGTEWVEKYRELYE